MSKQMSYELPSKLTAYVSPEDIARNEAQLTQTDIVEDAVPSDDLNRLLLLPLTHLTDSESLESGGLLPHADRPDEPSNTHGFDASLGLDECVFMEWPRPHRNNTGKLWQAGSGLVLIDSAILDSPRCFVTPKDLFDTVDEERDEFGDLQSLTAREQDDRANVYEYVMDQSMQVLDEMCESPEEVYGVDRDVAGGIARTIRGQIQYLYFDQIVSGATWRRHVARLFMSGVSLEALPTSEIKHTGKVDERYVLDIIPEEQVENYLSTRR